MRKFYDICLSFSTASTSFSCAVFLNYLLRYYPGTQRVVVVLLLIATPVLGTAIYLPKYRVVAISLASAFLLGVVTAWLT